MSKIVEILPALGWGGAQIFCVNLCNELVKEENEVTLMLMYHHTEDMLPLSSLDERIKVVSLGKKKGLDVSIAGKLRKAISSINPDIVHTHLHAGYYTLYAALKLHKKNIRFFHTFHNPVEKDCPNPRMRKVYGYFFRKKIVTPVSITKEILEGAKKEYGNTIDSALINCNTVPASASKEFEATKEKINALKKDRDTKVFLNIARIAQQKNQHLLLDCMRKLEQENVNAIAIVIGETTKENEQLYEELVKAKPANVYFLGKVSNVGDYILNADALVLSSFYEALPIALQESFSAGLIPVCTPVGGMLEIITPAVGFLSKDLSAENFTAALKKFLAADNNTLQQMRENGKQLFQKQLSMEVCAAKYQQLFIK